MQQHSHADEYGPTIHMDGGQHRQVAQGYVSYRIFDPETRETIRRVMMPNTVVNDARRAAARTFSNTASDFRVAYYRCGFSNVINDPAKWDTANNRPKDPSFDDNAPLLPYDGVTPDPGNTPYFHTQADVQGADGLIFDGFGNPLVAHPLGLTVDYPFNGDEYACRLFVELDGSESANAIFDTVEIILVNGWRFAVRWTYPIQKQPGWGLAIEHLVLF